MTDLSLSASLLSAVWQAEQERLSTLLQTKDELVLDRERQLQALTDAYTR